MNEFQPMTRPISSYTKRCAIALACFCSFGVAGFPSIQLDANESSTAIIVDYAENLRCVGFEMRDEIKTHFKHSKGYGKMLVVDAQIRARSAALSRRICRDACYRGLERDVQKLKELTCELTELYDRAVCRAAQCIDRPIPGDTLHVAAQLARMSELSNCLGQLVSQPPIEFGVQGLPVIAVPAGLGFNPNVDVAPQYMPAADQAPQLAPHPVPTQDSEIRRLKPEVVLEAPIPTTRSVLEK